MRSIKPGRSVRRAGWLRNPRFGVRLGIAVGGGCVFLEHGVRVDTGETEGVHAGAAG